MSETKDEATARGWSGKPAGGVEVRQTVAPLPTASGGAAVAPAERPQSAAKAKAPVIAADSGYAVFFFPAALEALGPAIDPYLVRDNGEPHVLCSEVDTSGAFIEATLEGASAAGDAQTVELMFPANMVRMIVTVQRSGAFGFARPGGSMKY